MRNYRNRKPVYKKKAPAVRPYRKRKLIRKRKNVRIQRRIINGPGFGFPATKVIPMRYTDIVTLTTGAGTMQSWNWRANSIYDPDNSGTGHQPIGHDQWAQFYGRYCVIGSKIRVYCNDSSTAQAYPFLFGVQLVNDTGSALTDYTTIVEQGREKFSIHNRNYDAKRAVSHGFSMKKFFNLANCKDNMQAHGAHFGANPVEQATFRLWLQSQDKTSSVSNNFLVIIDYSVLLSEPLNLPQS